MQLYELSNTAQSHEQDHAGMPAIMASKFSNFAYLISCMDQLQFQNIVD